MNMGSCAASSIVALGNAWASAPATQDHAYQVISFSGGASLHSTAVTLILGSAIKWKGHARSSVAVGGYYGEIGPVTGPYEKVAVHTKVTGNAAIHCEANLCYREVLL